ncbi:MAG: 50S ribosomal protein L15 [Thaumarchaeota archaeon]|nr:50S ribosomal protein L15 [Candidatus Geocrenenecus arthurdayi]MCL7388917.1 50S ribosomal protein L15 [Candidatus Geocrenenecus arthurdayi]MCL7391802.1 50S ribosomal protein L15 [Candidatus Geocrenenecus arthurdayi]MCL7396387.1 50S ribosomal protein L15 [Candidatus Geocrenenecus arthurdayi]
MPTRFRKVRKRRGSRTHGWGQIGQHRKTGAKGGRGEAGKHKHKWTWVLRYDRDYFGKHGFFRPNRREVKSMNLLQLATVIENLEEQGLLKTVDDRIVVDLNSMGVKKIIGGGRINRPLVVIVENWTKTAEEKIREAGGEIIRPGEVKV